MATGLAANAFISFLKLLYSLNPHSNDYSPLLNISLGRNSSLGWEKEKS